MFRKRDVDKVEAPMVDPMVISAMISPALVRRILIDCGSSVNIIFKKAYDQMKMEVKDLKPSKARVHGFNGAATDAIGFVELPVELGEGERRRVRILPFIVLDVDSPYNVFLGRPTLAEFRGALAPWCLTLKFPTDNGVGVVHDDQATGRACYAAELREAQLKEKGKGMDKIIRIQASED